MVGLVVVVADGLDVEEAEGLVVAAADGLAGVFVLPAFTGSFAVAGSVFFALVVAVTAVDGALPFLTAAEETLLPAAGLAPTLLPSAAFFSLSCTNFSSCAAMVAWCSCRRASLTRTACWRRAVSFLASSNSALNRSISSVPAHITFTHFCVSLSHWDLCVYVRLECRGRLKGGQKEAPPSSSFFFAFSLSPDGLFSSSLLLFT